ncbi:MAG: Uroporphyrinogen decarboxylase [Ignavibacteriaceae bacterium]|nr:Uroporphyrinogen decarboxylase [Ignavibacteriaceae bacterium]
MTGKERIARHMNLGISDRTPVMCQLSIGHYFLHSGIDPVDIWFESEAFAEALIKLADRYNFDGILVNLPGRGDTFKKNVREVIRSSDEIKVVWKNGYYTLLPVDDNPHYYTPDGERQFPVFDEIDPEKLYYIEPWDITEVKFPFYWGFNELRDKQDYFPDYHFDTIRKVKDSAGGRLSVHSEVFSPWSQFLELLNYENALMAIMDDPVKVKAILTHLTEGTIDLAIKQAGQGADAILISSAFAGAGLISREQYREFVLPYEREIITEVKKNCAVPVYTHTCGSIGDRLDLMLETGTNGIDTLDPPPLGTVDLAEAKQFLLGKVFIKGNIDPVNTLLYGSRDDIIRDVKQRIAIGKEGGGYILSSACSVAPHTPPENIKLLAELAEEYGTY